jgi:hypothetical protein
MAVTMTAMTAVHKHVHQWTGQQQQERQCAKQVGAVFAQQKVRGDSAEYEETDGISRTPKRRRAVLLGLLSVCMVMIHQSLQRSNGLVLAALIRRCESSCLRTNAASSVTTTQTPADNGEGKRLEAVARSRQRLRGWRS